MTVDASTEPSVTLPVGIEYCGPVSTESSSSTEASDGGYTSWECIGTG